MSHYKEWISSEGLKRIRAMSEAGYTNQQIYRATGIKHRTFYYWLNQYPEFKEAVEAGRKPKEEYIKVCTDKEVDLSELPTETLISMLKSTGRAYTSEEEELKNEYRRLNLEGARRKKQVNEYIKKIENIKHEFIEKAFWSMEKENANKFEYYYDKAREIDAVLKKVQNRFKLIDFLFK